MKIGVLVVEDECMIRLNAVDFIEEAGFRAHEASCADAAIRILEARQDIGFVFTDVNMPGSMDGLELARLVNDRWPAIALIVTSGREQKARSDLPAGAVFVGKPYMASQIIEKLRSMLESPARVSVLAKTASFRGMNAA